MPDRWNEIEVIQVPHAENRTERYARRPRFTAEKVYASEGVCQAFRDDEIVLIVSRHYHGDRGDLPEDSFWPSEFHSEDDLRLSRFRTQDGRDLWVVTNPHSESTEVFLDEEAAYLPSGTFVAGQV